MSLMYHESLFTNQGFFPNEDAQYIWKYAMVAHCIISLVIQLYAQGRISLHGGPSILYIRGPSINHK